MSLTEKQIKNFNNKFFRGADDECWEWTGAKNIDGYGVVRINNKTLKPHRVALFLHTGLYGECACHTCDNPSCVNPSHLWWDTVKGNNVDMCKKGRNTTKLTADQVLAIRNEYNKKNKITTVSLAQKYGVSFALISYIINRKIWAHI
tara:strand:+ start:111 stop:551 length:441 start_codon:yes stop_codon:yes gene_type:complete